MDLDTVLFDFVCGGPPTHERLVEWITRFPELREELITFAVAWALSDAGAC